MQRKPDSNIKLLPLRRFAVAGLYDVAYLSLLVQRKTLKARKIGRNYYTTAAWFEEYLDKHARDEIRNAYDRKQIADSRRQKLNIKLGSRSEMPSFFSWKKILASLVITTTVLILLFYGWRLINAPISDNRGIVAGASEINIQTGTSSSDIGR